MSSMVAMRPSTTSASVSAMIVLVGGEERSVGGAVDDECLRELNTCDADNRDQD